MLGCFLKERLEVAGMKMLSFSLGVNRLARMREENIRRTAREAREATL